MVHAHIAVRQTRTRSFWIESKVYGRHEVLFDAADWPLISRYSWHLKVSPSGSNFYARSTRGYLHRMLLLPLPGFTIDHKNGNSLDNRRANLRICTMQENLRNRRADRNSSSQYVGVTFDRGRWRASVGKKRLGTFKTEIEAARARDRAAKERFGDFARLNFPEAA